MSAYSEIDNKKNQTPLDKAVVFCGILPVDDFEEEESEAAAQELLNLRSRLAKAEKLLKRLEWVGIYKNNHYTDGCPDCGRFEVDGHSDDCELAAFLKGVK